MKLTRLPNNPMLVPHMDDRMGDNLNGPSLIKVPDWIDNPLGKYYLYFGHHDGRYIRLAYSDDLSGPWQIHTPGGLDLADSHFKGHIASPDVHIDDTLKRIRMYFHGSATPSAGGAPQSTRVAISNDGLNFTANHAELGRPYWRVFEWRSYFYALGMPGIFYRSKNGIDNFEEGPTLFDSNIRHVAVDVKDAHLRVFYTEVGDAPERIKLSLIDLNKDWHEWSPTKPTDVLKPEFSWEGADAPNLPSSRGLVHGHVNQLRDPALFHDDDYSYLLYSAAGESGIAIARFD